MLRQTAMVEPLQERQVADVATAPPSSPRAAIGTFSRFRPGFVYHRRIRVVPARSASGGTLTQPEDAPPQLAEANNFVGALLQAQERSLLQAPQARHAPARRGKKQPPPPRHKSARIVALSWPRGDTQTKAHHVLMKRLGILQDEGQSSDDLLLSYFALFRGPLTTMVIKALTALCGLENATAT